MKTFYFFALILPTLIFSQTKDYSYKQLLKNEKVINYAKVYETNPKNIINFLKCLKKESSINQFKKLPFFTGQYPLIVNEKIKDHNTELWEAIALDCKEKTIFNSK